MKMLKLPRRQRKIWQKGLKCREVDRRVHLLKWPFESRRSGSERVEWQSYILTMARLLEDSLAEHYPKYCTVRRIHGKALAQRKFSAQLMREQRLEHRHTWPATP